jgi:hypothetical protein
MSPCVAAEQLTREEKLSMWDKLKVLMACGHNFCLPRQYVFYLHVGLSIGLVAGALGYLVIQVMKVNCATDHVLFAQVESFVFVLGAVWATATLEAFLRLQLSVLGRMLYIQSATSGQQRLVVPSSDSNAIPCCNDTCSHAGHGVTYTVHACCLPNYELLLHLRALILLC